MANPVRSNPSTSSMWLSTQPTKQARVTFWGQFGYRRSIVAPRPRGAERSATSGARLAGDDDRATTVGDRSNAASLIGTDADSSVGSLLLLDVHFEAAHEPGHIRLERRCASVAIDEPSPAEARQILEGLKTRYDRHHQLGISQEALEPATDKLRRVNRFAKHGKPGGPEVRG